MPQPSINQATFVLIPKATASASASPRQWNVEVSRPSVGTLAMQVHLDLYFVVDGKRDGDSGGWRNGVFKVFAVIAKARHGL